MQLKIQAMVGFAVLAALAIVPTPAGAQADPVPAEPASEPEEAITETQTVASSRGGGWTITLNDSASPMDAPSAMIARLYLGLLGRAGEPEGLAFWYEQADNGMEPGRVAEHFLRSTEFMIREGESGDAFVGALYSNVLGREADERGREYWLGRWDLGGRDVASAAQIALEFTSSPEFTESLASDGYRYPYLRRTAAVAASAVDPIPTADIAEYTRQIFPEDQWRNVEVVVGCESAWKPEAVNVNPGSLATGGRATVDLGLFQINTYYQAEQIANNQHYLTQRSRDLYTQVGLDQALLDPYFNTEVAYMITQVEDWRVDSFPASSFRSGRWGSWTCANPIVNPLIVFWSFS